MAKKDKKELSNRQINVFGFLDHNPFTRGFGYDRFLFLQLAAAFILLALSGVAGFAEKIGSKRMMIYYVTIPAGLLFVVVIQSFYYFFKKKESKPGIKQKLKAVIKELFIYKDIFGWVLILVNVVVFTSVTIYAVTSGYEMYMIVNEFFVATWEQLTYAVVCMTLVVQFFRTGWLSEKFSRRHVSFWLPAIVIDIAFAFSHWWAYGGNVSTIFALAVVGFLFMAGGYITPSLGITAHFAYNIIVTIGGTI